MGSWFNGLCSGFNGFFLLNCDPPPPETGVHCITTPPTDKMWTPVELWPRVLIPRWIMTLGFNHTLNFDPESWLTLSCDTGLGSQFNMEFWPGVLIKRGTLIRGYNSAFELWPWVIIPRRNVNQGHHSTLNCDPGHYSTLNYDPRSWFNVELWPKVWIKHWIVTPIHDSTLNCDLGFGSKFNVEFWPGS